MKGMNIKKKANIKKEVEMGINIRKTDSLLGGIKKTNMIGMTGKKVMRNISVVIDTLIKKEGLEAEKTGVEVKVTRREKLVVEDIEVEIGRVRGIIATEIAEKGRILGTIEEVQVGIDTVNKAPVDPLSTRVTSLHLPANQRSVNDRARCQRVTTAHNTATATEGRDLHRQSIRNTKVNPKGRMSMRNMLRAAGRLVRPPRERDPIDRAQGE